MASYKGLVAASPQARASARGASKKRDTNCELVLRAHLRHVEAVFDVDADDLPGRPDLVFRDGHVVVFVDGDFWHGRDIDARLARLSRGHNAPYWTAKISKNRQRDESVTAALEAEGWRVLRFWEKDVLKHAAGIADLILRVVRERGQ